MPDTINSPFGPRLKASANYDYEFHPGIDLAAPEGTPVYATADGTVRLLTDTSGRRITSANSVAPTSGALLYPNGGMVVQLDHGSLIYTNSMHLSRQADGLTPGSAVKRGDIIGFVGHSGNATFDHLHFETRAGSYYERDAKNPLGYLPRAVDPPAQIGVTRIGSEVTVSVEGQPQDLNLNEILVTSFDQNGVLLDEVVVNFNDRINSGTDTALLGRVFLQPAPFNRYSFAYLLNVTFSGIAEGTRIVVRASDVGGTNAVVTSLVNTWTVTGNLVTPRYNHTATLLPDGDVLVVGGTSTNGGVLSSAELYDPLTGSWTPTGSMTTTRTGHTATLLPDGEVLVVGGLDGGTSSFSLASAELYSPAAGTWHTTGSMFLPRVSHTGTLLPNGKVLVAGGDRCGGCPTLKRAELYNPATGTWGHAASMHYTRSDHSATLLNNGKILVAGGVNETFQLTSAEVYDPVLDTWNDTGSMSTTRASGFFATTMLDGNVLAASACCGGDASLAEIYNSSSGTWAPTGSMNTPRDASMTLTLLPDGKVLAAGGTGASFLRSAELYDPSAGTWGVTASMGDVRSRHTATLLADGRVLVAGGYDYDPISSAELYGPAPTPSPTPAPTPSPTPTPTPSPTSSETPSPTPTPTIQLTATKSPTPTAGPTLTPSQLQIRTLRWMPIAMVVLTA